MQQSQQKEWRFQWQHFAMDEERFLLMDWIYPQCLQDFTGLDVLEAGCGNGVHTQIVAEYARHVTAVDLNTADLAEKRLQSLTNVRVVGADIATMDLGRQYDVVFSIGVVHHTDHPDKTVENLKRHVKPGGLVILWVYAQEGNGLVWGIIEPIRKKILKYLSRPALLSCAYILTALLYVPVYTLYLLPLARLPFYAYFENFRKLPFRRNCLNVFDKLNAPQVSFLNKDQVEGWFKDGAFNLKHCDHYKNVSWRLTAVRK